MRGSDPRAREGQSLKKEQRQKMKKIFKVLLFATILALPLYAVRFSVGPIPSTLLEILIYLTFIFALISGSVSKIKNKRALILGGLFVLVAMIGVLVDPDKIRALGLWKAYFFDGFLIYLSALGYLGLEGKNRGKLSYYLIYSGVLAAAIALVNYFGGTRSDEGRLLDFDGLSPNYLAMYLSPILALDLGLIALSEKTREKIFCILLAVFFAMVLLMTGSRGAILALGAAVLLLGLYFALKTKFKAAARVGFWAVLILVLAGLGWYFRPDFTSHARKASSSNVRYYIWSTSLEMIGKNPIWGVGLSNYQDYFSNLTKDRVNYPEFISPQALTAHNLYLQFYLVSSIFGPVVFIVFILFSKFWNLKNLPAALALMAILAYGLVDTPFFRNDLAGLFWVIMGFLVYETRR